MLRRLALCAALAVAMAVPLGAIHMPMSSSAHSTEMQEAGLGTLSPAQLAGLDWLLREKASTGVRAAAYG
jgi:hypothetical protein